ncbi:hypothetical protein CDAR_470651 [Caerostris darwini]|uniref:Uncharacterized protein n=1 Tax=Caerostris darwini TaxID=1538125 RepID=A0AAV4VHN4_9ARAC|nr:hypothetical protein CDAR_470651 [Caerostris darwini]
MPRSKPAMPCKKLLSKVPQKLQEEVRSESSEDRQAGLETIGERRAKETEQQVQLSLDRKPSCRTRRREILEQRERRLQYKREWYQRVKSIETPEQREKRLVSMRARYKRVKETETSEGLESARVANKRALETETIERRERRLECRRLRYKRVRETETLEQGMARLEKCRKIGAQKKVKYLILN